MLAVFAERIYVVSAVPAKEEAAADGLTDSEPHTFPNRGDLGAGRRTT